MLDLPTPETCDEPTLARFAADLGVPRLDGEDLETWRARVVAAFQDDTTIDRATPNTAGTPMVLGGMKLGA